MPELQITQSKFTEDLVAELNKVAETNFKMGHGALEMGETLIEVYHAGGSRFTPAYWTSWGVLKQMPYAQLYESHSLTDEQNSAIVQFFADHEVEIDLA